VPQLPEVVQSLNLLAVLNPGVRTTMIDGALFQAEVEARQIMAVPYVFLNGKEFSQGRISLEEILAKIDTSASERAAEAISAREPFDVLVVAVARGLVGGHLRGPQRASRTGVRRGPLRRPGDGHARHRKLHLGQGDRGPEARGGARGARQALRSGHHEPAARHRLEPAGDDGLFTVKLESGAHVKSKTVIISTGAAGGR